MAQHLYKGDGTDAFSYDTYRYTFLVLLESLAGLITGGFIAVLLDMKLEALLFLSVFFLLRSYAGGIHFKTFGKCYLGSMGIMTGVLCISKYFWIPVFVSTVIMILSISVLLIIKPADLENRSVEAIENIYFRRKLLQILVEVVLLYIIFAVMGRQQYAVLIAITTMVVVILVLLGRWIK